MNDGMDITDAYNKVKNEFPFHDYMGPLDKYDEIINIIQTECPHGAKILSIGSGPCDLEAILSLMGYSVTAVDDLQDPWHKLGNNTKRIKNFANEMGIIFFNKPFSLIRSDANYDMVLLIDIIEHLHESPMNLLNVSISLLKEDGILLIKTPNIVALNNRILLLMGKNIQNVDSFYWNIGSFRSHVMEYSKFDINSILLKQKVNSIKIKMVNTATNYFIKIESNPLKKLLYRLYKLIVILIPNFRDTIIIYGKKPVKWEPIEPSISNFKNYYYIEELNLDKISDEEILTISVKKD